MDAKLKATLEITGYGRMAADEGEVTVAQTGETVGSVAARAVAALEAGDLEGFRRLYRRSRRLRLDAHGKYLDLSYGSATLAIFRLPDGMYCRPGDETTRIGREIGLFA